MSEGTENTVTPKSPPLWLPEGSVRAILALGITAVACYTVINGLETADWFIAATVAILNMYFNVRDPNKQK